MNLTRGLKLVFVFALFSTAGARLAIGGPSLGGPPGRPDTAKWKERRAELEKQKHADTKPSSPETGEAAESSERTKFTWNVPSEGSSQETADASAQLGSTSSSSAQSKSASSSPIASSQKKSPPPAVVVTAQTSPPSVERTASKSTATSNSSKTASAKGKNARYDAVLTEKQKTILRDRAKADSLDPTDYDHLLSKDEKKRLDGLLLERQRELSSGE